MRIWTIAALVAAVAGCNGQTNSPSLALPQVRNAGGPVLSKATLVAVTFAADGGDPETEMEEDFVRSIPGTTFSKLAEEYGVQSLSAGAPIRSTLDLGTTVDDKLFQDRLGIEIEQSLDGFGPPPPGAIFLFFIPPWVTVTALGQTSCTDFGGYHSAVKLADGTQVAYAVVVPCASFNGLAPPDSISAVASHEILEAATDPYFTLGHGAWANIDSADLAFELIFGSEVADLCLNSLPSFYTPPDLPYVVQRIWSNAEAKAGHDPCVPAVPDAGAYIQAQPELDSSIALNFAGTAVKTKAVSLAVGQSATVTIDLFSTGPTEPWSLGVLPLSSGRVKGTLDRTTGVDGDQVHLTLTLEAAGSLQGQPRLEAVAIESQLGSRKEFWPILIASPQ